ncbi:hypothetical protein B5M09_013767 [Aphanomyces astaci]|uniref:Uncharacterized protein n=1 Tax=Aphanomyces astaci TaxID=112090 RepID=A0A425BYG6_APHAT|nr:hypothetical protein B5M09_013767 [Aphanomyces astaci]
MTADVRFRDNPLVLDGIKLRSFVGYPLVTSDGFIVGVLGVADTRQLATHVSRVLEERSGYQPTGHQQQHHHVYDSAAPQAHSQTYNVATTQSTIHNTLLDLLKKTEATGKTLQQTQQSMLNATGRPPQS